ncbi:MAG: hypothetical protein IKQ41_01225 [Clostridia bacterium]|nr:hypothetical protein [Clostridia bacterium]
MDRKGVTCRALLVLLIVTLAVFLAGCRTRTKNAPSATESPAAFGEGSAQGEGENPSDTASASREAETGETDGPQSEEADGRTKENPDASRKEYDENAPAEVVPATDHLLHGEGEGNGAPAQASEDTAESAARLNAQASEAATQIVPAREAEQTGVSEEAEQADSAMVYFTALLQERTRSLFECQRVNVYLETAQDHVTIHKSSPEHALILNAGAYDVSSRLLSENLKVDNGWVARKNPQMIVKLVDKSVLGGGAASFAAAKAVYKALCAREDWAGIDAVKNRKILLLSQELLEAPYLQTAAALMIAKTANPELYSDVNLDQALGMLAREAAGTLPAGLYYYSGKEE